jgi:hypothetical protein
MSATFVECEVCEGEYDKDKCVRLTPWDEPVTPQTEWCCARCASEAMKA